MSHPRRDRSYDYIRVIGDYSPPVCIYIYITIQEFPKIGRHLGFGCLEFLGNLRDFRMFMDEGLRCHKNSACQICAAESQQGFGFVLLGVFSALGGGLVDNYLEVLAGTPRRTLATLRLQFGVSNMGLANFSHD